MLYILIYSFALLLFSFVLLFSWSNRWCKCPWASTTNRPRCCGTPCKTPHWYCAASSTTRVSMSVDAQVTNVLFRCIEGDFFEWFSVVFHPFLFVRFNWFLLWIGRDIVQGEPTALLAILRFLRDRYDLKYLFQKKLLEAQFVDLDDLDNAIATNLQVAKKPQFFKPLGWLSVCRMKISMMKMTT